MKKKSNALVYILLFLITICLAGGIVGLMAKKSGINSNTNSKKDPKDFKVTYKYYLDGEEVNEMVKQDTIQVENPEFEGVMDKKDLYTYDKYTCTNEVTGSWNNEQWSFTPELTADTTCRLYFLKIFHEVTVNTTNGLLPNNTNTQKFLIERNNSKITNVIPTEGYKIDTNLKCTNEVNAVYNEETKDLTISNVNKDSICTIPFVLRGYEVEIQVSMGEAKETKKTANFGDTVTFETTPLENYIFDTVNCTNNQVGEFDQVSNILSIKNLNNDTKCVVQFKQNKHQVNLKVVGGALVNVKSPLSVDNNGSAAFPLSKNEGYKYTGAKLTCDGVTVESELNTATNILTIKNVTQDLNCTYTLAEDTKESE